MKYLRAAFFIFCILLSVDGQSTIRFIYFDPSTTVTPELKDGVIVLELSNGSLVNICMDNQYVNNNAKVVCRMMNYTKGSNANVAYNIISSKKATVGSFALQNIQCNGTEQSLENCTNFNVPANNFLCTSHNQDLHVYCGGDYDYDTTTMNISVCNGNLSYATHGFLSVTSGSTTAYFCGINSNFGFYEAQYFCKYTLCSNTAYAQIVEGYPTPAQRVIGGFNSMSCDSHGCVNLFPFKKDRCTPNNNIAVICTNSLARAYPSPSVVCSNSSITLSWDPISFMPYIGDNVLAIQYANGTTCSSVTVNITSSYSTNLTANFGECDMIQSGDFYSIYFIFRVVRKYPTVNNVIVNPDNQFNVSCLIARNQTVSQGPIIVQPLTLPPSSSNVTVPSVLTLHLLNINTTAISNLASVQPGTELFVKVVMVNPPPNITLVLSNCFYGSPTINLITNSCPVTSIIKVGSVNEFTKYFSFILVQSLDGSTQSQVVCITSKCSNKESNCPPSCQ